MGTNRNCVIPGCITANQSSQEYFNNNSISIYAFPSDPSLLEQWKESIPLDSDRLHESVICSLHFSEEDFESTSSSGRRLQANAVPSVFPEVKSNMEDSSQPSDIFSGENTIICIEVEELRDLDHLESEISSSTLPSGILYQRDEVSIDFFYVEKHNNKPPTLGFSLLVYNDLHFKAYVREKEVLFSNLEQLRVSKFFKTYFEILQALNSLKKCLNK